MFRTFCQSSGGPRNVVRAAIVAESRLAALEQADANTEDAYCYVPGLCAEVMYQGCARVVYKQP